MLEVNFKEVEKAVKNLRKLEGKLSKAKLRKPLRQAAKTLVNEARTLAPVSNKPHARYKAGRVVAVYYPGNLRRSIRILPLRRTLDIFVGYYRSRGGSAGVFKGRRVDPYYARFIEKKQKILFRAAQRKKRQVAKIAFEAIKSLLNEI